MSACSPVNTTQNTSAVSAPPGVSNSPPAISGQPATQATAGIQYSFTPSARDADGDALSFTIENKPTWATFSTSTGSLTGTPTSADAGSYAGIVIRVSDGSASVALASFSISVAAAGSTGNGTASLSWSAPTQNTDGSALADLAGYWVYHGTQPNDLQRMQQVVGASTTQYVATGLSSGTHYFAVSAYNAANTESGLSNVGSKSIP